MVFSVFVSSSRSCWGLVILHHMDIRMKNFQFVCSDCATGCERLVATEFVGTDNLISAIFVWASAKNVYLHHPINQLAVDIICCTAPICHSTTYMTESINGLHVSILPRLTWWLKSTRNADITRLAAVVSFPWPHLKPWEKDSKQHSAQCARAAGAQSTWTKSLVYQGRR